MSTGFEIFKSWLKSKGLDIITVDGEKISEMSLEKAADIFKEVFDLSKNFIMKDEFMMKGAPIINPEKRAYVQCITINDDEKFRDLVEAPLIEPIKSAKHMSWLMEENK